MGSVNNEKLFYMGFLVTDTDIDDSKYPFYGNWKKEKVLDYTILCHPKQSYYVCGNKVLIGHAYNPFIMVSEENLILQSINEELINQLTGIFTLFEITEKRIKIYGDATCMQSTFYGVINGHCYISSHPNLIGDLLCLKWDTYIKELVEYKFFKLFGMQLPGNLSEYKEIKRLIPNYLVEIIDGEIFEKRFHLPHTFKISNDDIVDKVSILLNNNLKLISQKWKKPAISLTGGCDSKTTLACANGLLERFEYFSYISTDEEEVDAEAAAEICDALGINHIIYNIPRNDNAIENLGETRRILNNNCGNMLPSNSNDIRKRAWFAQNDLFDVEVKSWASEIGRAYYSKRFYGRKNFGKSPTPRKCSTMYKVFLTNRKLLRKTDRIFAEYLSKYFQQPTNDALPWQEQFFWEFRVSAWNALVITHEQRYSYDITIPYNNRIILEYLLSASLEDRINDTIYKKIRKKMNTKVDSTNISVQNVKHTLKRAFIENLYYMVNTNIII